MTATTEVETPEEVTPRKARKVVLAGGLGAVKAALTGWLGRPLASFHLVLAVCGLLVVLGLVMVLSASSVKSYQAGDSTSVYTLFVKQGAHVLVGTVLFWIALRLPMRWIRQASPILLALSVLALILVLTPLGVVQYGTRGWFIVGPFSFQPVEVAKLALALWGAHILVLKRNLVHQYRHLLVPVVPAALLMFTLVMLQPDLGSTITLGVVMIALLWFVGAPLRLFVTVAAGGMAGILVLAIGAQYRLARVVSFFKPDNDVNGGAYQAKQALFALADGGLFGKGLGQGPTKWGYLPNVHNDFIFALIGEELGFVGCALVLALFGMLAVVGMRIATRNLDPWIKLVAATLTAWLVGQAGINIGYVVGLLPVTGIPLPLISYGGTSVVVTMLVFGLLANCARNEPESVAALRTQGPGRFGRLLRLPAPEPYKPPAPRPPARATAPPPARKPAPPKGTRPAPARTAQSRVRNPRAKPPGTEGGRR